MIADISLQGHECHALRSLGRFPTSHPMPYIFMEWSEVHERLSLISRSVSAEIAIPREKCSFFSIV